MTVLTLELDIVSCCVRLRIELGSSGRAVLLPAIFLASKVFGLGSQFGGTVSHGGEGVASGG